MNADKKNKVLIIDDEKINIIALAQYLKSQYDVSVAVNGVTGLEEAQKQRPDIILLDILMPDMSGFEVIEMLKHSETTADIPVIFITGLDSAINEEKGLLLGAVDYIIKPFHRAIVERRIKTHLLLAEYIRKDRANAPDGLPNPRGDDPDDRPMP